MQVGGWVGGGGRTNCMVGFLEPNWLTIVYVVLSSLLHIVGSNYQTNTRLAWYSNRQNKSVLQIIISFEKKETQWYNFQAIAQKWTEMRK